MEKLRRDLVPLAEEIAKEFQKYGQWPTALSLTMEADDVFAIEEQIRQLQRYAFKLDRPHIAGDSQVSINILVLSQLTSLPADSLVKLFMKYLTLCQKRFKNFSQRPISFTEFIESQPSGSSINPFLPQLDHLLDIETPILYGSKSITEGSFQVTAGDQIRYFQNISTVEEYLDRREKLFSQHQPQISLPPIKSENQGSGNKVFIVHGHNHTVRNEVASYIRSLKLEPIILQDEPNRGQTVIEKFEAYANQSGFAIVILTDDDLGEAKSILSKSPENSDIRPKLRSRARQNVILEFGYFIGKLGRDHVCGLIAIDEDENHIFEEPSDIKGLLYVRFDENWKNELEREIKAVGLLNDF